VRRAFSSSTSLQIASRSVRRITVPAGLSGELITSSLALARCGASSSAVGMKRLLAVVGTATALARKMVL
jgi:hypothetical protein